MRRPDLAIPFQEPVKEKDSDLSSTFTSTLPMVAMFTRNKMLGWVSFVFSLLNWLAETPDQKKSASTPGYLSVGMAAMAMVVTYLPLFMPPPPQYNRGASGTEAPAAVPP